jgi:hypothetical protein
MKEDNLSSITGELRSSSTMTSNSKQLYNQRKKKKDFNSN